MKFSEIRKDARNSLKGKWGTGALIILLSIIIESVLFGLVSLFSESSFSSILSLVVLIIIVPLSLGLIFAFMKLKRNEEVKPLDFITLGFSNFGKSWRIYFAKIWALLLPTLISFVGLFLSFYGSLKFLGITFEDFLKTSDVSNLTLESTGSPTLLFVGLILMFIGAIYSIIKAYSIVLTEYVAYDEPELGGLAATKKSQKLMKGNKFKYFILVLSFIGWLILSMFTLGIGLLWLTPYMQVAFICFYDTLINKKEEQPIETKNK